MSRENLPSSYFIFTPTAAPVYLHPPQHQKSDRFGTMNNIEFDGRKLYTGCRFDPTDNELVELFLGIKVKHWPMPVNNIEEVQLYKFDPDSLTRAYKQLKEGVWYFYTHRVKKTANGNKRADRTAGDGHWRATTRRKQIKNSEGAIVGSKATFVYHTGKKPIPKTKTNWIMHEYSLGEPKDKKLDDWVLCRIYYRTTKKDREKQQSAGATGNQEQIWADVVEENNPFLRENQLNYLQSFPETGLLAQSQSHLMPNTAVYSLLENNSSAIGNQETSADVIEENDTSVQTGSFIESQSKQMPYPAMENHEVYPNWFTSVDAPPSMYPLPESNSSMPPVGFHDCDYCLPLICC